MTVEDDSPNLVVVNPVWGVSLNVCDEVDDYIESPWRALLPVTAIPDYTKIADSSSDLDAYYGWRESCPLHYRCSRGDVDAVRDLFRTGIALNKPDFNTWTALHYACWQGHVDVVKLLLGQNDIYPNLQTELGYTSLHFACGRGHHLVVKTLLEFPYIDKSPKDKAGRTPLELCDFKNPADVGYKFCSQYLKESVNKEPFKLKVIMPDFTEVEVFLDSGSNTTVTQILAQLRLTPATSLLFALSIASEALAIQLRPEYKPLQAIRNWSKISGDSSSVMPRLVLTRDIRVEPSLEAEQTDIQCFTLLYHEAVSHYLFRCCVVSEAVAVELSTLLALIYRVKHVDIVYSKKALEKIIPLRKTWCKKFVKKVRLRVKEQEKTYGSSLDSNEHLQSWRSTFSNLVRQSVTYGSCFFHAVTTSKGFATLVAINYAGLHIVLKPNSVQSELIFSCPFGKFNAHLNKPILTNSSHKSATYTPGSISANSSSNPNTIPESMSFTISSVGSAGTPHKGSSPAATVITLTSKHAKLIVSLIKNLSDGRKSAANMSAAIISNSASAVSTPVSDRSISFREPSERSYHVW